MRQISHHDRLITSRALEQILAVSYRTVWSWAKAGKIPAIRLPNGANRYRQSAIDAWLAVRSTS